MREAPFGGTAIEGAGQDTVRRDTTRRDTTARRADTIKAPVRRDLSPQTNDVVQRYHWDRKAIFASGALTLTDLVERLPEVTTLRGGWLRPPEHAAFNGALGLVRVFLDGFEIDALNPRAGDLLELETVQLWTLEDVLMERTAGELRIHLRSWTVDRTTPYTRTDVYTGTQGTNLYRGYFGRRYGNGAILQAAGQNHSTEDRLFGGAGDAISLLARAGIARERWSLDGYVNTTNGNRTRQTGFQSDRAIPNLSSSITHAYLRGAWGAPESGRPWLYVLAVTQRFSENSQKVTAGAATSLRVPPDTVDTARSQTQYVVGGGMRVGALALSATERLRHWQGDSYASTTVRADLTTDRLGASLAAENDPFGGANRIDASARFLLRPGLTLGGALSSATAAGDRIDRRPSRAARGEVALRVREWWLNGGVLTRDSALLPAPIAYGSIFVPVDTGASTGFFGGITGDLLPGLTATVNATVWGDEGYYHPRTQARTALAYATQWLSRFPRGNFELRAETSVDYRYRVLFPVEDGTVASGASRIINALLEVRIIRGILTVQSRNVLGTVYQRIPFFVMPRAVTIYGVRWEFWN